MNPLQLEKLPILDSLNGGIHGNQTTNQLILKDVQNLPITYHINFQLPISFIGCL